MKFDNDQITSDAQAIQEILVQSFDVTASDAEFMLYTHGEDVLPVPGDVSYHEAAKELLASAIDWGDIEDLDF